MLSPFIAQSMVYGSSLQSCTVAVVIPEEAVVEKWAQDHNLAGGKAEVITNADFKKEIMDDMARLAKENKLSGLEKPKDIYLTLDAFSIENDQLTPTFKLKRNIAQKAY